MNQETFNQVGSALSNLRANLIPTDSALYGRRLVKAIRAVSEYGVYYFGWGAQIDYDSYGERVLGVQYQPGANRITVRTPKGKRHVEPASWSHFIDGYGRHIVASRSAR